MSFTPSERTQYLVELALIVILLIIVIMVIARLFGPSITGMINQFIQTPTPTPTPTPAPESIRPILFI